MLSDRSEWRSKKRGHCIRTDLFCNPDIQAGVITNEEFAIFQNAGYMGLYGGLDVEGILAAVYQSLFGGDVYPSLEEKVANLLFNEIGNSQVV